MALDNQVIYELLLKDGFSAPLENAEHKAKGFHESVMHIIEALGIMELAHKAFEFIGESLKEFEAHQVAVASLTQMYKNNSDSVGMNVAELKELAEQQQKLTGIHSEEIMTAEQRLMKFKQIRVSYEELIPVVDDFAKATGVDAAEAANTLGRALENPERAARLMMQAGMSPGQQEMYKTISKTGDAAKAQSFLIEALGEKYKGVAKAMFDANPSAQIEIQMKELKETFGEVEEKIMLALMPAIKSLFEFVQESIAWVKEHKEQIKEWATYIGILTAGFVAYKTVLFLTKEGEAGYIAIMAVKNTLMMAYEALLYATASGMGVMEVAQLALNAAMDANPIGAIILVVTALTAALYGLIQSYKEANDLMLGKNEAHKGLEDETKSVNALADRYVKLGYEKHKAMAMAVDFEKKELTRQAAELGAQIDRETDADKKLFLSTKMLNIGGQMSALADKQKLIDSYAGQTGSGKFGSTDHSASAMTPKSDKVAGQSHVTINVTIQKMTGIDKFVATSVKGAEKAGENVEKMLLAAINQFQASVDS